MPTVNDFEKDLTIDEKLTSSEVIDNSLGEQNNEIVNKLPNKVDKVIIKSEEKSDSDYLNPKSSETSNANGGYQVNNIDLHIF